jgi:endonuclease G
MTGVFYLSREQYLIAWNPRTRNPDWSAWQLTASDIGTVGRTNKFLTDQDLASVSDAVRPDEYKGSCLDRGHVTPSGDRTDTSANNRITFYMSNMLPQTAFLNRMAWKHLEDYERQLASKYGEVFIYAGPLYDEGDEGAIGPHNDILIPTRMYKVMADAEGNVLAAVIMRNATSTGTSPVSDREQACIDSRSVHGDGDPEDWREYSVSVEDIEHHTGMQWTFLKKTKK